MKWVLRTSSIIVDTEQGKSVFRSMEECPPEVLRRIRETLPGPNSCTIMITNQETLNAFRNRSIAVPRNPAEPTRWQSQGRSGWSLPRWQVLGGALLLGVSAITALLVWAMGSV